MTELPEVGVQSSQPGSQFSLVYTAIKPTNRVELRIYTDRAVTSSVLYGGVAMTCTHKDDGLWAEYHYELHHPPMGSQVVSGTFSDDVLFVARLFDDAWFQQSST